MKNPLEALGGPILVNFLNKDVSPFSGFFLFKFKKQTKNRVKIAAHHTEGKFILWVNNEDIRLWTTSFMLQQRTIETRDFIRQQTKKYVDVILRMPPIPLELAPSLTNLIGERLLTYFRQDIAMQEKVMFNPVLFNLKVHRVSYELAVALKGQIRISVLRHGLKGRYKQPHTHKSYILIKSTKIKTNCMGKDQGVIEDIQKVIDKAIAYETITLKAPKY